MTEKIDLSRLGRVDTWAAFPWSATFGVFGASYTRGINPPAASEPTPEEETTEPPQTTDATAGLSGDKFDFNWPAFVLMVFVLAGLLYQQWSR